MILVTGASEGIGFACVRELLARTSSAVLATGRSQAKLDRARASLDGSRERFTPMVCDQSCDRDLAELLAVVERRQDLEAAILTVGVNPAYTEGARRLHALSVETITATIHTNCVQTLRLSAALLDGFRRRRAGVLVLIGSQAQDIGLPGAGLYCATKSFLSGLARTARHEYAERGVRVHLAHPGIVRTPRTAAVADDFAARHGLHVAEPSDVARQIVDLLLDGDPAEVEMNLC